METNSFTLRSLYVQENSRQHLVNRTTSELQDMSNLFTDARHRIGFLVYSSRSLITIPPGLSRLPAPETSLLTTSSFYLPGSVDMQADKLAAP